MGEVTKLDDSSIMPWGKYKGEKMANVPANYFLWLYDNDKVSGDVKVYIESNLEVLKEEGAHQKLNKKYD